jgi:hypothetical protein
VKGYADLADLEEDRRITIIVRTFEQNPTGVAAVCVDDEPEKIKRYREKILARLPTHSVRWEGKGPVPGVYTLQIGPKPS